MFDIYSCQCKDGCFQKLNGKLLTSGGGEHHLQWQTAAQAIEDANDTYAFWGRFLFGLNIKLRGDMCMADVVRGGLELPDEAELQKIRRLDKAKILGYLPNLENSEAEYERQDIVAFKPLKASRCIKSQLTVDSWEESFGYRKHNWTSWKRQSEAQRWKERSINPKEWYPVRKAE